MKAMTIFQRSPARETLFLATIVCFSVFLSGCATVSAPHRHGVTNSSGPNWQAQPHYGTRNLNAGFRPDPDITQVIPGGNIDLASRRQALGIQAAGFVSEAPDLDLIYESGRFPLVIRVEGGNVDTVLLVNCPAGRWHYNDDTHGIDPQIVFRNPQRGMYNIWVGTFNRPTMQDRVRLLISEVL